MHRTIIINTSASVKYGDITSLSLTSTSGDAELVIEESGDFWYTQFLYYQTVEGGSNSARLAFLLALEESINDWWVTLPGVTVNVNAELFRLTIVLSDAGGEPIDVVLVLSATGSINKNGKALILVQN